MCVLVSFGVRVVHHSAGSCILLGLVLLALLRIQINYAVLPGQYVLLARLSTKVAVLIVVLSLDDLLLL